MIDNGTMCQTLQQENAVSAEIIPIWPHIEERRWQERQRERWYAPLWEAYRSGQMSTAQLLAHWRNDPVFEAYCVMANMRQKRKG